MILSQSDWKDQVLRPFAEVNLFEKVGASRGKVTDSGCSNSIGVLL
jgi:hypothetical protein